MADPSMIPRCLLTPSIALFNMAVTLLGGNAPFLVPVLSQYVGFTGHVTITFEAAATGRYSMFDFLI
jgi:hypothetical protein